jgi:hypothetical protein
VAGARSASCFDDVGRALAGHTAVEVETVPGTPAYLSRNPVKTHPRAIDRKRAAGSRAEAVARALALLGCPHHPPRSRVIAGGPIKTAFGAWRSRAPAATCPHSQTRGRAKGCGTYRSESLANSPG